MFCLFLVVFHSKLLSTLPDGHLQPQRSPDCWSQRSFARVGSGSCHCTKGPRDQVPQVTMGISISVTYPLVNCPITMENHHFQWVNPLFLWPFSIAMLVYQRVDLGRFRPFLDSKCSYLWCFSSSQPAQPTYSDMSSQPPPWYPKRWSQGHPPWPGPRRDPPAGWNRAMETWRHSFFIRTWGWIWVKMGVILYIYIILYCGFV